MINLGWTYEQLKITLIRKMQFLKNDLTFIDRNVCILYRKNLVSYKIALINYM